MNSAPGYTEHSPIDRIELQCGGRYSYLGLIGPQNDLLTFVPRHRSCHMLRPRTKQHPCKWSEFGCHLHLPPGSRLATVLSCKLFQVKSMWFCSVDGSGKIHRCFSNQHYPPLHNFSPPHLASIIYNIKKNYID